MDFYFCKFGNFDKFNKFNQEPSVRSFEYCIFLIFLTLIITNFLSFIRVLKQQHLIDKTIVIFLYLKNFSNLEVHVTISKLDLLNMYLNILFIILLYLLSCYTSSVCFFVVLVFKFFINFLQIFF